MGRKLSLQEYLLSKTVTNIIVPPQRERFMNRLKKGAFTREENPLSHFGAMFVPYNPNDKKVLVVHHRKARSWIFAGGHIEKNELPIDTAQREAKEELGIQITRDLLSQPFIAQVFDITNSYQKCREHYDVFFAFPTTYEMQTNTLEFHGYEWLSPDDANKRIELQYYKDALAKFVEHIKW